MRTMRIVDLDRALAEGIDCAIQRHRESDPAKWSNRDVAQRMTAAGYPMQHPAVVLTRQGKRKVGAAEWMTWARVLSVQPLSLLDVDAKVTIGAQPVSFQDLQKWIHGRRPLPSVDAAWFYNSFSRLSEPVASVFAAHVRGLLDDFDTADRDAQRAVLEQVMWSTADQMRNQQQVTRSVQRRAGGSHGSR